MPVRQLRPTKLDGLGALGLNTQSSSSTLGPEWLVDASNVIFDYQGRIGPRKGIKAISKVVAAPIKSIGEYVKSDRTTAYYVSSGSAIYLRNTATTPETLTAQSFGGSPQTISNSNWQWHNFNNEFWGVQKSHKVINYDGSTWKDIDDLDAYVAPTGYLVSATGTVTLDSGASGSVNGITVNSVQIMSGAVNFDTNLNTTATAVASNITAHTSSPNYTATALGAVVTITAAVTASANTFVVATTLTTIATTNVNMSGEVTSLFDPSCALGNFGRIWYGGVTLDSGVVYYSDNLIGEKLAGGAAGLLDLRTVWGQDEIVGLASLMDKLIIFGKNNIAIYNGASDPSTMALDELIKGVGLAGRDNIVYVGSDLLFLSYEGLQSFSRIVQSDGKAPINDFSISVRNALAFYLSKADLDTVKTIYYQEEGLVITLVPENKLAYVFDFSSSKQSLPKITTWSFATAPLCGLGTISGDLIFGSKTYVAKYDGYFDVDITNTTSSYGNQSACEAVGGVWDGSACYSSLNRLYNYTWASTWLDFQEPTTTKILKEALFSYIGGRGSSTSLSVYVDHSSTKPYTRNFNLAPDEEYATYGDLASQYNVSKFTSKVGPIEYKIPLGRTGKVIKFKMVTSVVGDYSSLVSTTVLTKQGKVR